MTECCTDIKRRSFLASSWNWVKLWAAGVILLPVLRFTNYNVPSQPLIVIVNKTLKRDGFIIEPEFVIFDLESGPVAVSRKCTHLGCRLNFHELENILICPCHQSRFDKTGKRLAGPAERDLPLYNVDVLEGDSGNSYQVTVV